ncbi:MAG: PEFG-CTERM sorting domain-containing protein [Thaumarchaeota archaeon]|nr:PEFG-CTERM sorting domain-containing protein [Nitrososphaerota archaeon]
MHIQIFSTLMILTIIVSGTAFAEDSLISVQTDDNDYDEGDTILISGAISTIIGDTQITMQLFEGDCSEFTNACNLIDIAQIEVSRDGNYFHTLIAQGPLWKTSGDYTIKVVYGAANAAETQFTFIPKSQVLETIDNFEVNAGDSGTFDVTYAIRGGIIKDLVIDPDIFGLVITIESQHDGKLVLDLPRKYIDAEKQDGKDDIFIVLIDNVQTTYQEPTLYSDIRTITIEFEEGDSEIQIIGTYVIPEFGTIAMIVLTIGIITSILFTRNKFQIKI